MLHRWMVARHTTGRVSTCFISTPAACEGMYHWWGAREVLWRWDSCCKVSPCSRAFPGNLGWAMGEAMAGPLDTREYLAPGFGGLWASPGAAGCYSCPRTVLQVVTRLEAGQSQGRAGPTPFPRAWPSPQLNLQGRSGVPCHGCRANRAHGQPHSPRHSPGCDTWQPRAFWSHSSPRPPSPAQGPTSGRTTAQWYLAQRPTASAVNLLISHDATQDALPQLSRMPSGKFPSLYQPHQQVTSSPFFQHPLSNRMPAETCLSFCTVHAQRSTVLLWLCWPLCQKPFPAGPIPTLARLD